MEILRCEKTEFAVVGKEGSTKDGEGFIQRLWADANGHFGEIADLAIRDGAGRPVGIWGCMTDFSRAFKPWEGFSQGLYLAGVECEMDAQPPEGWTKWIVPGFEYLYAESEGPETYPKVFEYMAQNGLELAGAAQDFSCPETGKDYVLFPIRRLEEDAR